MTRLSANSATDSVDRTAQRAAPIASQRKPVGTS